MKKETKEFIIGNSHIFDNTELDERQKAEAYKITFRLFIAMTYTLLFMSMSVFAYAGYEANATLLIAGAAVMIISQLFIVLYAAMASSKGVMNLEYARKTSHPAYVVSSIAVAAALFAMITNKKGLRLDIDNMFWMIYMLSYVIESLLLFYYSRRNMKVLENQLKDDED